VDLLLLSQLPNVEYEVGIRRDGNDLVEQGELVLEIGVLLTQCIERKKLITLRSGPGRVEQGSTHRRACGRGTWWAHRSSPSISRRVGNGGPHHAEQAEEAQVDFAKTAF
jgi:hypothetical protein